MLTFDEINDATGFANGEKFVSEADVRNYFTVENMYEMVGGGDHNTLTQDQLDEMATFVIASRLHCEF